MQEDDESELYRGSYVTAGCTVVQIENVFGQVSYDKNTSYA